MQPFKRILNFYINSSIHVALAVVSLVLLSFLEFNLFIDTNLTFYVFFGSITGYNFVKYAGIAKLHHRSLAKNLKLIQVFSLLCFLAFLYFLFQQELKIILISVFFGFFTLLYAVPLRKSKQNLRNIGGIKIFIIAFVWAGVVVILPLFEEISIQNLIFTFFQRFFFVIAIMLPFEIRDLKFDALRLNTIPQQIGIANTKKIGYVLLGVILLLELLKTQYLTINLFVLVLILLILGLAIKFAKVGQGSYYSSFWVESIPIIWLLVWWLFKVLV